MRWVCAGIVCAELALGSVLYLDGRFDAWLVHVAALIIAGGITFAVLELNERRP